MIKTLDVGVLVCFCWHAVKSRLHAVEFDCRERDGGCVWFRARVWPASGKVFFTTIAGDDHGAWDAGDLVATAFDPITKSIEHQMLHAKLQRDDHAVAGCACFEDGRCWLFTASRQRIGSNAGVPRFVPATLAPGATSRRSMPVPPIRTRTFYRLPEEKNWIINFHRGRGYNRNCNISDDGGATWRYGWRLMQRTRDDLVSDPRYTGMDGSTAPMFATQVTDVTVSTSSPPTTIRERRQQHLSWL